MTAFGCGSTDGDVVTTSDHVVLRYELELAKDPGAVICQPGDGVLRNVFPHIDVIDADITHISPDLGPFESPGFVNFTQFFRQWDDGQCEFTITTKIRNPDRSYSRRASDTCTTTEDRGSCSITIDTTFWDRFPSSTHDCDRSVTDEA
jgi:hypothetical protein